MEYIHHIYMGMVDRANEEFIIVVPQEFEEKRSLYKWPKADNIRFELINNKKSSNEDTEGGIIRRALRLSRLLHKYVRMEKTDSVFLISFMDYLPFLPFFISSNVKVSGIIYKIYLYRWKRSSWKIKLGDVLKYVLISKSKNISTAFILNDAPAARRFNTLYKTGKFHFITDPYNAVDYTPKSIRNILKIDIESKVFLHFGGLNRRKGTLEILKAVKLLDDKQKRLYTFIFAGKVYKPIYQEYYALVRELQPSSNIIVIDSFVSNEQLADLCVTSDFILAPYSGTIQSSGVLGHAAYWGKPVIGPSQGLVGKLIKRHNLGVALSEITPETLADVMYSIEKYELNSSYKEEIAIKNFLKAIFEKF